MSYHFKKTYSYHDKLYEIAKSIFEVSKPVFKVISEGRSIDLEVKAKHIPAIMAGDPITELLASNYSEQFDRSTKLFTLNHNSMIRSTCDIIEETFIDFLENYQGIKNPKQSKLFLHTRDIVLKRNYQYAEQTDLLLELYRYLRENIGDIRSNPDSVHRRNVLAIFHKIKEKHEAGTEVNR